MFLKSTKKKKKKKENNSQNLSFVFFLSLNQKSLLSGVLTKNLSSQHYHSDKEREILARLTNIKCPLTARMFENKEPNLENKVFTFPFSQIFDCDNKKKFTQIFSDFSKVVFLENVDCKFEFGVFSFFLA